MSYALSDVVPSEWTVRTINSLVVAANNLTEGCSDATRVRVTHALLEFGEQIRQGIELNGERQSDLVPTPRNE